MLQVKKMLAAKETMLPSSPKMRDDDEEMATSRDESLTTKRKASYSREPEDPSHRSPGNDTRETVSRECLKGQKSPYLVAMETDSPPAFPKHVIVPSPESLSRPLKIPKKLTGSRPGLTKGKVREWNRDNIVTPILSSDPSGPPQRGNMYGRLGYRPGAPVFPEMFGRSYAPPPEMEAGPSYNTMKNVQLRPKRWACDFCCVATFLTFEAACAHEETCKRRQANFPGSSPKPQFSVKSPYEGVMTPYGMGRPVPHMSPVLNNKQLGGLGALYQAVQEVQQGSHPEGTLPRTGGAPSIPSDPHAYPTLSPRFRISTGYEQERIARLPTRRYPSHHQRRMLLALPSDPDSLSDRQCYVRTEFVEVFEASDKEVTARHSKGAQKLVMGQVGIRCLHCAHLMPKDRAERAVCYPSSISRIYQTVADMQRFHFEQCREIPDETRRIYKSLKTTRPRGVGSPQTYWIQSAKVMNLIDSDNGIRFSTDA